MNCPICNIILDDKEIGGFLTCYKLRHEFIYNIDTDTYSAIFLDTNISFHRMGEEPSYVVDFNNKREYISVAPFKMKDLIYLNDRYSNLKAFT